MKKLIFVLLLLAIVASASPAWAAKTNPVHIFLLVGQSNMSGRGEMPEKIYSHEKIMLFGNDYVWKTAREPVDSAQGQLDQVSLDNDAGYSLGVTFAKTLRVRLGSEYIVALVPCARGSSSVSDWYSTAGRDTLYGSCISRTKAALRKNGAVLTGMIVFQGEEDAHACAHAEDWAAHFAYMVRAFRRDLQTAKLPVVFARLGVEYPDKQAFPCWNQVRAQQEAVHIKNVEMLDIDDIPRDYLHYTAAGYDALGIRFGFAMAELLSD